MVTLSTPDQSEKLAALAREQQWSPESIVEIEDPPLRRKLPAFARLLLQARRQGQHPECVTVVYGERWRGAPLPRLCVRPIEYAPGRYDWRAAAGVKVVLIDLGKGLTDFDIEANRYGNFFWLVSELVAVDAYVEIKYPEAGQWRERAADDLAYACRWDGRWPAWWNDDLNQRQRSAFFGYMDDLEQKILGKMGRDEKK